MLGPRRIIELVVASAIVDGLAGKGLARPAQAPDSFTDLICQDCHVSLVIDGATGVPCRALLLFKVQIGEDQDLHGLRRIGFISSMDTVLALLPNIPLRARP